MSERAGGPGSPDGAAPEWAGWMSPSRYDEFIDLCADALAGHGVRAVYAGDGVLIAEDGTNYGLDNLSRIVRAEPPERWPQVVGAFFDSITDRDGAAGPIDPSTVFLSCQPREALPGPLAPALTEVLPGIVLVPAVDRPTSVEKLFGEGERTRPLGGLAGLVELGRRNLARVRFEQEAIVVDHERPDSVVVAIGADDPYAAGRLGVLDAVVPAAHRGDVGIVVAAPHQGLLLVHAIRGAGMVPALNGMLRFARAQYASAPRALSPHLYFIDADGGVQRITGPVADSELGIRVEGPFAAALQRAGMIDQAFRAGEEQA